MDEIELLLKCPRCGESLIRFHVEKEGHIVDCAWMCINPKCRKGLEFPTYFGYTQEDMNNQEKTLPLSLE